MSGEVSLAQRQADYGRAEKYAEQIAARYLTARAGGRVGRRLTEEMDYAQAALRRAKRRLEETERRLAKKATA